jgi:hypothetical protein
MNKKSNTKIIMIHDFKLYCRAIAIKIAWYCHKNRHEDQCKRRPGYKFMQLGSPNI